jgi:hypothetical protein
MNDLATIFFTAIARLCLTESSIYSTIHKELILENQTFRYCRYHLNFSKDNSSLISKLCEGVLKHRFTCLLLQRLLRGAMRSIELDLEMSQFYEDILPWR